MLENDASNMVMPVSPMNGYANDGFGNGAGGMWWFLILFFLIGGGRWGNWGDNGGAGASASAEIQRGFDQNAVMSGVNGIASSICNGFADVQNALCGGFAGVNANVSAGFANAETAANARQMANMQQSFASQTLISQGLNALAMAIQNSGNDSRSGIADLKYTVATENCADRAALADGLRDMTAVGTANTQLILNAINGGIQSIKDDLCADRLEAVKAENQNLRTQLNMANLAASQNAQTAQLLADNAAQTQALSPVPRPAYIVANPNGCNCGQNTCGCGSI